MSHDRFDVDIRRSEIVEDGAAVLVTLRVVVPEGANLLEGLLTVSQDEVSAFAGINPPTDGDRHLITVRVPAGDGAFERGEAQISAFLLLLEEDGSTRQAQDTEENTLRGPRQRDLEEASAVAAQSALDLRASDDWLLTSI